MKYAVNFIEVRGWITSNSDLNSGFWLWICWSTVFYKCLLDQLMTII